MKLKDAYSLEGKLWTNLDNILKSRDNTLPTKVHLVKAIVFPVTTGHVWMWELDYKESWVLNNWCFWTVVLEKTLESPLDCKEIQPVIGRTDDEAETAILWPPDAKSWLIGKHPDAGKDWGQEEKGTTEDEMVGWPHWLSGHGFEWIPGVGDGQGGLTCCGSWGRKELDTTERLNWTDWFFFLLHHFKKSHRLVSGSPVIESGSSVALWPSFCNAKREKLPGIVCEESAVYHNQIHDVISAESKDNRCNI